ncbi:expressed unknown protein [Seminavis robusta]|uniref:Uncharacterized protein n=1 Tax=Seminavis robusta TaxID=568900 RepID=A0A9N8EMM4_9STRA|nr:expressed unknown protein [Seminavis robusta]|eukprot:Sro1473_g275560.1 n/a (195) ;mRNA; f:1632-2216
MMQPANTPSNATSEVDPYSPGWNQGHNASTASIPTAHAMPVDSSTSSIPSHSDYYTGPPQPGQLSEADLIAKRKEKEEKKKKGMGGAVGGAAAVAGVAGLMLVGPIVGVAAAGGAAIVAATNKGAAGSALRASGVAAAKVGSSARKLEQKTGVVKKSASGIATGVGWVAGKINKRRSQREVQREANSPATDLTS